MTDEKMRKKSEFSSEKNSHEKSSRSAYVEAASMFWWIRGLDFELISEALKIMKILVIRSEVGGCGWKIIDLTVPRNLILRKSSSQKEEN